MELTPIQAEMLSALITLQKRLNRNIKGEEIAKVIDRNTGTVRNQMQSLKALSLVEGIPGPKGGYSATSYAYQVLSIKEFDREAVVPVKRNGELIRDITVLELIFNTVHHPSQCQGTARMLGDIKRFRDGDEIEIGPTPVHHLFLRGCVIGRDDFRNSLSYEIYEMYSISNKSVEECKQSLLKFKPSSTIKESLMALTLGNLECAMVVDGDELVGIVDVLTLIKKYMEDNENMAISEVMRRDFPVVPRDSSLQDTLSVMRSSISDFVVLKGVDGYTGVVSINSLLKEIVEFYW